MYPMDKAIEVASRSMNKRHLTGCVIAYEDTIIDWGWAHTGEWRRGMPYSVHAEIHALMRSRHELLDGCVAYIACVAKKSGNIRNAMPCLSCATALLGYGIEDVVFTIPGGTDGMYLPAAIKTAQLKEYKKRP